MIQRKKILNLLTFSIVFLSIINILAVNTGWYYIYYWFDIPMHFIGGLSALFLVAYLFYSSAITYKNTFFLLLVATLLIGIAWEMYEYLINNIWAGIAFDRVDTLQDIFFDVLGGIFGSLIIKKNGN